MNFDVPAAASLTAEQSALGSILAQPNVAAGVFAVATPRMFWRPAHAILASLLHAMLGESVPIDPQTVLTRLVESGELSKVGGGPYLQTLMARAWDPRNAPEYAREVRDCYRRRLLQESATRLLQESANPEADLAMLIDEAARAVDEAVQLGASVEAVEPRTLDDLLTLPAEPNWLIRGLFERRERVMITGHEGLGKTECAAQVSVCAAAGLLPFTGTRVDPVRVLLVDLENSREQLSRRYRRIAASVTSIIREPWDHSRLMIEVREEGVDLTGGDDVSWLERLVAGGRPDLLSIGPLYKMHRTNMNDEEAARKLTHTLDSIRVRHNCALLVEAHAGNAEDSRGRRKMRPRGSSLFQGWPSVGLGLVPHRDARKEGPPDLVEMHRWRGDRDDRTWPAVLERGAAYGLPFHAAADYPSRGFG